MACPLAPLDLCPSIRHGPRVRRGSELSFLLLGLSQAHQPILLDDFGAMYKYYLLLRDLYNE